MSSSVLSRTDVAEVLIALPRDHLMGGMSLAAIGLAVAGVGPVKGRELGFSALRLEFQMQ